jgi:uncharacterized protein YutE (UPF0331/DUF86 family)
MGYCQFLVVKLKAHRGIGTQIGDELLKNATKRTFGSLLTEMSKAGVLEPELATRLKEILEERNWLVHRSKHEHHTVLTSRSECAALIARLERIREKALTLQKTVVQLMERYVIEQGVSSDFIEREAQRIVEQWGISQ